MAQRSNEDVLRHYGILGQKWGERRYQNPDGTYTEEGLKRKRNGRQLSDRAKKAIKVGAAAAGVAAVAYGIHKLDSKRPIKSNKELHDMDFDTLAKYLERLNNEKNARERQNELYPAVGTYVGSILGKIGKSTLTQVGTSLAVAMGVNWLGNYVRGIKMPSPKDKW